MSPVKCIVMVLVTPDGEDGKQLNYLVRRAWGANFDPLSALSTGCVLVHTELQLTHVLSELPPDSDVTVVHFSGATGWTFPSPQENLRVVSIEPREAIDTRFSRKWDWLLRSPVQWTDTVKDDPAVEYVDESLGARVVRYAVGAKLQPHFGRKVRARSKREWTGRASLTRPHPAVEEQRDGWLYE